MQHATQRTVDDPQHSPEQENDDECQRLFALYAGDTFDEYQIKCERRQDDGRVKHLHISSPLFARMESFTVATEKHQIQAD